MVSSLLLLRDDIVSILDDVSVMTKAAVKNTAGVFGDDLALNAKPVAGVRPARELPVVWAVGLVLVAPLSLGTRLAGHVRGLRAHG